MILQVYLIQDGKTYDITKSIQGAITWGGSKKSGRKVSLGIVDTNAGYHRTLKVNNGNTIIIKKDGAEVFRGISFENQTTSTSALLPVVAYDLLHYLVKNKDRYVFTNKTASEILTRICTDYQLPIGSITQTEYRIPDKIYKDKTLLDIIFDALDVTYASTGTKYWLTDQEGKISLYRRTDQAITTILQYGKNILTYNQTKSIEDTITKVKMEIGEKENITTVTKKNDELISKYGILQYYENVSDDINAGELNNKADKILSEQGKEYLTLDLEAIGDSEFISGRTIYVKIPSENISDLYYIEEDQHTADGNKYTTTLKLEKVGA